MSDVKLVTVTPDADQMIAYMARVSNPKNQDNTKIDKLLSYCVRNGHWSIFEMANLCVEITTSRAIARQILRHRSFSFQEFSQRYATLEAFEDARVDWEPRTQDTKNRQASHDTFSDSEKKDLKTQVDILWEQNLNDYQDLLNAGVAKECARAVLPEGLTKSVMYMNGTIRSWIHYIELRAGNGTQVEHQEIANQIKDIFSKELPITAKALGFVEENHE